MIRLLVLGGITLRNASGMECRSITAQPKRIALLAYLAIAARAAPVRRDTVLALFWPELDTDRARHALRQSLYHIRQELGNHVVLGNGDDELQIDGTALSCDVVDFYVAFRSGAHEAALNLFNGDLLPGLHVSGAPDFDQWIDTERAHIRRAAQEAATTLSAAAATRGETSIAVDWTRRAHHIAPFDEVMLRRLLELLDAAGDAAGAIVAFERFADRLDRELGVAPSAETTAMIAAIRARGPRNSTRQRRRIPANIGSTAPSGTAGRGSIWTGVVPAFLILLGAVALAWPHARRSLTPTDEGVIAIIPFHIVGPSPDSALLADGIPDLLALNLQTETGPRVVDPRVSSARWRRATLRNSATTALAREVARSAGAGLVVEGSVLHRDSSIVISARLVDVRSGAVVAKSLVEDASTHLVAAVSRLSARMTGSVLREDPRRLDLLAKTSYEAVQYYLDGKAAARRGDHDRAVAKLGRALEIDSTFALAALAMVDVIGWAGQQNQQVRYEQLAYRYRDRLGPRDALYLRAWTGLPVFPGHHPATSLIAATEEAVAAMPDRPEALYLLGDRYFHVGAWHQISDAVRRSRTIMERALALDPDFGPAREHLVELAVLTDDAAAVRRYRDLVLEKEPGSARTPFVRWLASQYLRDPREQRRMRFALDTMNGRALSLIVETAQEHGFGLDDADRAARIRIERAATDAELDGAKRTLEVLLRNRGRHEAADSLRAHAASVRTPTNALAGTLTLEMLSDLPTEKVMPAYHELVRRTRLVAQSDSQRAEQSTAVYATERWRLWHRDTTHTAASLTALYSSTGEPDVGMIARVATIEAMREHLRVPPEAVTSRPALERLDSLVHHAPLQHILVSQLILLNIFRECGMIERGLQLSRRRLRGTGTTITFHARFLREEGWFAAAAGDRAAAVAAYRIYLALRAHPDPSLTPSVDSVRVQHEQLTKRQWLHDVTAFLR